jgi:hypothetical protein
MPDTLDRLTFVSFQRLWLSASEAESVGCATVQQWPPSGVNAGDRSGTTCRPSALRLRPRGPYRLRGQSR